MSGIFGFLKGNKGDDSDSVLKDTLSEVSSLVDGITTTEEEKAGLKNNLSSLVFNALFKMSELQSKVITTEMNGNFLQRSWRPLVMLVFATVVVIAVFTDTHLNDVPEDFWGLLKIGIGGYVGGRTVEKVATTVTKNVDLSMLRKKDRKEFLEKNK